MATDGVHVWGLFVQHLHGILNCLSQGVAMPHVSWRPGFVSRPELAAWIVQLPIRFPSVGGWERKPSTPSKSANTPVQHCARMHEMKASESHMCASNQGDTKVHRPQSHTDCLKPSRNARLTPNQIPSFLGTVELQSLVGSASP